MTWPGSRHACCAIKDPRKPAGGTKGPGQSEARWDEECAVAGPALPPPPQPERTQEVSTEEVTPGAMFRSSGDSRNLAELQIVPYFNLYSGVASQSWPGA